VAAIQLVRPDIVVLDSELGEGDGFDVLREARQYSTFVILSSQSDPVTRQKYLDAGARYFFGRSDELESFVSALRQLRDISRLAPAKNLAGPPKRTKRILVADDNAVNRKLAQSMLRHLGFEADVVPDGDKAVKAASRGEYALVLMDLQMPVLDGYEATQEIRNQQGAVARLPIIAVSACSRDIDGGRHAEAGMNGYLEKPLSIETLRGMLDRWLPD
jgi:CheY-like chemotaxis protein